MHMQQRTKNIFEKEAHVVQKVMQSIEFQVRTHRFLLLESTCYNKKLLPCYASKGPHLLKERRILRNTPLGCIVTICRGGRMIPVLSCGGNTYIFLEKIQIMPSHVVVDGKSKITQYLELESYSIYPVIFLQ